MAIKPTASALTLDHYCTIAQAAAALAVDAKTIRRWIASGQLTAVKIGPRGMGTIRDNRPVRIPLTALATAPEPVTIRGSL